MRQALAEAQIALQNNNRARYGAKAERRNEENYLRILGETAMRAIDISRVYNIGTNLRELSSSATGKAQVFAQLVTMMLGIPGMIQLLNVNLAYFGSS